MASDARWCSRSPAAGADVVIVSRKQDACDAMAAEVHAETGRDALAYACHVGQWDALDALVDAAYERFGHVDVLVNNAGMSPLYDRVVDVSEELYDKVLDVNLKGPFRLTALVGTRMAEGGGGSIINISSSGGDPAGCGHRALRRGQGGAQRDDGRVRARVRTDRPRATASCPARS